VAGGWSLLAACKTCGVHMVARNASWLCRLGWQRFDSQPSSHARPQPLQRHLHPVIRRPSLVISPPIPLQKAPTLSGRLIACSLRLCAACATLTFCTSALSLPRQHYVRRAPCALPALHTRLQTTRATALHAAPQLLRYSSRIPRPTRPRPRPCFHASPPRHLDTAPSPTALMR
jgi:hypothetical protein